MTTPWRRLAATCLAGIFEIMLFFPIVLFGYVKYVQDDLNLATLLLVLVVGYCVGHVVNVLTKFRHPFPRILLALIIGGGMCLAGFGLTGSGIASTVLLAGVIYRGGRMLGKSLTTKLNAQDYMAGLFMYFIGSLFNSSTLHIMHGYSTFFLVVGLLTLISVLFLTNSGIVARETLSGEGNAAVEPAVRRNNMRIVGVAIALIAIVGLTYQLQAPIARAGRALLAFLKRLLAYDGKPGQLTPVKEPPQIKSELTEHSRELPAWVDVLPYIIGGVIFAILLFLLARRINRLPGWFAQLRSRFARLFARDKGTYASGYVDRVEKLAKSQKTGSKWANRFRSREGRVKWKDLKDNEARVRYLYRDWITGAINRGFRHQSHQTPREIHAGMRESKLDGLTPELSETLVNHYQTVRYGNGRMTDEQVKALADRLNETKSR